jgi:hypothetical protein
VVVVVVVIVVVVVVVVVVVAEEIPPSPPTVQLRETFLLHSKAILNLSQKQNKAVVRQRPKL